MNSKYFSLTFLTKDTLHSKGDRVLVGADRKLFIGTNESADLRIDGFDANTGMLAVLKPTSDGDGWCIINLQGGDNVRVGGRQVKVASPLEDGCHVQVCDTELIYNELSKDNVSPNQMILESKKHTNVLSVIALCLVLTVIGLLGYLYYMNRGENFTTDDEQLCSQWIYRIKVDKIYLERKGTNGEWIKADSVEKDTSIVGTCFIACDRGSGNQYLITARHCIEPWLETEWKGIDTTGVEPELRWAIDAENSIYNGDSTIRVTSLCHVLKKDSVVCDILSSDFKVDRRNDQVINMSIDVDNPLMFRSITPIFHDHSMEMGDIAFVESPIKDQSQLLIAGDEFMHSNFDRISELHLFGFPQGDKSHNVEKRKGTVSAVTESSHMQGNTSAYPEAFWCMVSATPGFSGGPMVTKHKDNFYVLGLLSYVDPWTGSRDRFRIVPVAVITRAGVNLEKPSVESLIER